jgi:small GTP-binding protein
MDFLIGSVMFQAEQKKWCIVTLGDYAVGKTSLIKALADVPFSAKELTTIGMDPFETTLFYNDRPVDLTIWDTAGQERFKSLIPVYSRRSDAALLVFDISNLESFKGLEEKLQSFLRISEARRLVFVVATKMDLVEDCMFSEEDAKSWADAHELPIYFTSAKTGQGIQALKDVLAKTFAEAKPALASSSQIEMTDGKSRGCC